MLKRALPLLQALAVTCLGIVVSTPMLSAQILPALSVTQAQNWRPVGIVNIEGPAGMARCSGTLIAPDLVLTAAHCAPNKEQPRRFVLGGIGAGAQDSVVSTRIQHHPAYAVTSGLARFKVDIALITLARPVEGDIATPFSLAVNTSEAEAHAIVAFHRMRPATPNGRFDCKRAPSPDLVLECRVIAGNSGAPALNKTSKGWQIIGVVTARLDSDTTHSALVAPIGPWVRAKLKRHLESKQ